MHITARIALNPVQLAHHAADVVDLDPLGAGGAAQRIFQPAFHPDLADLEFRDLQHRIGVLDTFEVFFRHRPHIAQDMGEIGVARIDARHAGFGRDTGQGGGVEGDAGKLFPVQPVLDGDRHEGAVLFQRRKRVIDVGAGQRDHMAEPV